MRKELDQSDGDTFDLKHGAGGIGDIEFLVQYLVLRSAAEHTEAIVFSDNIRQIDALVDIGVIDELTGHRLQGTYRAYRLFAHRRVLDGQAALGDAKQFNAEREFVIQIWRDWLE